MSSRGEKPQKTWQAIGRAASVATILAIGFGVYEYFHNVYPVFRQVEQLETATQRAEELEEGLQAERVAVNELRHELEASSARALELETERDALSDERASAHSRLTALEYELENVGYQAVYSHALMIVENAANSAILRSISPRGDSMYDLLVSAIAQAERLWEDDALLRVAHQLLREYAAANAASASDEIGWLYDSLIGIYSVDTLERVRAVLMSD